MVNNALKMVNYFVIKAIILTAKNAKLKNHVIQKTIIARMHQNVIL